MFFDYHISDYYRVYQLFMSVLKLVILFLVSNNTCLAYVHGYQVAFKAYFMK